MQETPQNTNTGTCSTAKITSDKTVGASSAVGPSVGMFTSKTVGCVLELGIGLMLGTALGVAVGCALGLIVGSKDGEKDGESVGNLLGVSVG